MNRVAHDRLTCKQVDLCSIRKNEGIKLGLYRGIRNLGQATLTAGDASDKKKEGIGEKGFFHGKKARRCLPLGVLEKLVSELLDVTFPFLDDRVKLRNLIGVVSLLVPAEKEKVGLISRAPAVKEQTVLLNNAHSKLIGQWSGRESPVVQVYG